MLAAGWAGAGAREELSEEHSREAQRQTDAFSSACERRAPTSSTRGREGPRRRRVPRGNPSEAEAESRGAGVGRGYAEGAGGRPGRELCAALWRSSAGMLGPSRANIPAEGRIGGFRSHIEGERVDFFASKLWRFERYMLLRLFRSVDVHCLRVPVRFLETRYKKPVRSGPVS